MFDKFFHPVKMVNPEVLNLVSICQFRYKNYLPVSLCEFTKSVFEVFMINKGLFFVSI